MARDNTNTFDAGSFGTLRYDFTAFGGKTGPIQDPSDKQIQEFIDAFKEMAEEEGLEDDFEDADLRNDPDAQERMRDAMENFSIADAQAKITAAVEELCSGSPKAEELMALPFRVRQGYVRWLQEKLMNPEASASDTPRRRSRVTGG